jgi:hypothetical protein
MLDGVKRMVFSAWGAETGGLKGISKVRKVGLDSGRCNPNFQEGAHQSYIFDKGIARVAPQLPLFPRSGFEAFDFKGRRGGRIPYFHLFISVLFMRIMSCLAGQFGNENRFHSIQCKG